MAIRLTLLLEDAYNDIVRKAMFGLGIGIEALAEETGVSVERLQAIHNGAAEPSHKESGALAAALRLNAEAFWAIVQGWHPPAGIDTQPYKVRLFRFADMASNGYVVQGGGIRNSLLVDPGGRGAELVAACDAAGGVDAILLTHTHFDHVQALPEVLEAFPEVQVMVHAEAFSKLKLPAHARRRELFEGSSIWVGGAKLEVWEAPGHSEDGLLIRLGNLLFTGDTLFAGSLGRSAQGPATYDTLLRSAQRILKLPRETRVLPGHGPISTVELEAAYNPFLRSSSFSS